MAVLGTIAVGAGLALVWFSRRARLVE